MLLKIIETEIVFYVSLLANYKLFMTLWSVIHLLYSET